MGKTEQLGLKINSKLLRRIERVAKEKYGIDRMNYIRILLHKGMMNEGEEWEKN